MPCISAALNELNKSCRSHSSCRRSAPGTLVFALVRWIQLLTEYVNLERQCPRDSRGLGDGQVNSREPLSIKKTIRYQGASVPER